jgi:hypothetical protein
MSLAEVGSVTSRPRIVFFVSAWLLAEPTAYVELRARLATSRFESELLVYGPEAFPNYRDLEEQQNPIFLEISGMSRPLGWYRAFRELRDGTLTLSWAVNQTPLIVATVWLRLIGRFRVQSCRIFHTTILRRSEASRLCFFSRGCVARGCIRLHQRQSALLQGRA